MLTYKKTNDIVDAHISGHREFLGKYYQNGQFLMSGRKVPRTGGVIMALGESKQEILNILKEDPFYQHEVADYEVIEFLPSMTCEGMEMYRE
ncbi:YciI family protein [Methanogenium cariaci]|jgi:uncharacterized protein YciI